MVKESDFSEYLANVIYFAKAEHTKLIAKAFEKAGEWLVREAVRNGRSLIVGRNGKPVAVDARELAKKLRLRRKG